MATQAPSTPTTPVTEQDMDATAKKGWDGFTKFLLGNVITTIIALLVVGLLTVWR